MAKQMDALAGECEHTASQLAMAWLFAQPSVTSIITGTSRIESLEESVGALSVELTDAQQTEMDQLGELI